MTDTAQDNANAFPEPARGLYLAMKEAEQAHIDAVARVNAIIEREDATGEDLADEFYSANATADEAEKTYFAAQRAFNEAARPIMAERPNMGYAL